jgi:integrase
MSSTDEPQDRRIDPEDALELYLRERRDDDLSDATIRAHEYRLSHFVRWCDHVNLDSLTEVSATGLDAFATWRQADGDLSRVSVHTQLSTLKVFVRWAGQKRYLPETLYEFVEPPKLHGQEGVSEVFLDDDDAAAILERFRRFDYASSRHVSFLLLWTTGRRVGGIRGLDVADYDPERGYVEFHHRPENDTPLKMAKHGENPVSLSDAVAAVLDDYIQHNRLPVEDEYGRRPLVTTRGGRPHTTTLRDWCYAATRPCLFRNECPHARDELV